MLAPISWRVPPRHYGPWEQFVSLLTEGLVERGVDVTLFATADSQTRARLVGSAPTGYSEDPELDAKVWEALHISAVFERAGEFDLIHNSFDFLPLDLQPPGRHSGRHDDPRLLVPADHARVREVRQQLATTWRSATQTEATSSTTSQRSITASTCASSSWARRGRLPAVLRENPSRQGNGRGDRGGRAGRSSPDPRRDRPGSRVLRPARGAADRRRAASPISASSAADARSECSVGPGRSCTWSTSRSRSGSASSRPWPAGRR